MNPYDPDVAPDPAAWLAIDESERSELAARWHSTHDEPELHVEGHQPRLHAVLHAVVEAQIAAGDPPVTGQTVARLVADGLRRHAALHAVMAVLVDELYAATRRPHDPGTHRVPIDPDAFAARLVALDAAEVIAARMRRALGPGQRDSGDDPPQMNRADRRALARRDRKSTHRR